MPDQKPPPPPRPNFVSAPLGAPETRRCMKTWIRPGDSSHAGRLRAWRAPSDRGVVRELKKNWKTPGRQEGASSAEGRLACLEGASKHVDDESETGRRLNARRPSEPGEGRGHMHLHMQLHMHMHMPFAHAHALCTCTCPLVP